MPNLDSVFLGYTEDANQPIMRRKVLMVRRKDGMGSWYLPGGGHPFESLSVWESITHILKVQTSLRVVNFDYLAHWQLSNGTLVRLLRPTADLPTPIGLSTSDGDKYVTEIGWKNHDDLVEQHLQGLTPWAQFKMAMYTLDPPNYMTWNNQPKGDSFGDEFRAHDGKVWVHPKFR